MPVSHEVTLNKVEYDDIVLRIQDVLPVDAVSPRVEIDRVEGGVLLRIQDIQGLHTASNNPSSVK